MGVTIHFEGHLADQTAFNRLMEAAQNIAVTNGWLHEHISSDEATLLRVGSNEEAIDYVGPTRGLLIRVHDDCDPIRLEFDQSFYLQEFVKTQFAGTAIHIHVVETLQRLRPFFAEFKVEDEGEFWETGNLELLLEHIDNCNRVIKQISHENPNSMVKVKDSQGRIMDVLE